MALLNTVIDLYHQNTVNPQSGFHQIKTAGILGVIHKATQGVEGVDPEHDDRKKRALSVGLLWGSYHFGIDGDGTKQADHFLSVTNPQPGQLMVLDFEPNPQGGTMTIQEAEAFVTRLYTVRGAYPTLYSGQSFLTQHVAGLGPDASVLFQCPLWIARYGPLPHVPTQFGEFALWQYTDGALGMQPHSIPGVGRCDRNKFNGDEAALRLFWG